MLRRKLSDGVMYLTLSRPSRLNALNLDVMRDLVHALEGIDLKEVTVLVLSGEGRAFCSGWDRKEDNRPGSIEETLDIDDMGQKVMKLLWEINVPSVVKLQGPVIGGGLMLAAACDIRVAASDAVFCLPEIKIGSPVMWAGLGPLVGEIGPSRARWLAMTGAQEDAEWARHAGLVHQVVDAQNLEEEVEKTVDCLQGYSSAALRSTKSDLRAFSHDSFNRGHGNSGKEVYEYTTEGVFGRLLT